MEERIFTVIFGVLLVAVGFVCRRLIPQVDRLRESMSDSLVPKRFRRGLNAYGKYTFTAFCFAAMLMGLFLIYLGLFDRVRGW